LSWESEALKTVEEFDRRRTPGVTWLRCPARFILTAESVDDQVFAIGGAATEFVMQKAVEASTP
jgi:hypothetical protein